MPSHSIDLSVQTPIPNMLNHLDFNKDIFKKRQKRACFSSLSPTRFHVRTQREDSCVWTRKKTLTRHWIYWCLDLGLPQPPELWDMNFCCLWAIQSIEFLLCNPNRLRHSLFLSGLWADDLLSPQVALDFTIFSAANLSRKRSPSQLINRPGPNVNWPEMEAIALSEGGYSHWVSCAPP